VKNEKKIGRCEAIVAALRKRAEDIAGGHELGSEVALAKEFGVSRMTARKAVDALVSEGLLERRAGIGVFVRGTDTVTRHFRFIAGNLLWDASIRMASAARARVKECGAELELRDAQGDEGAYLAEIAALPNASCGGAIVIAMHGKRSDDALKALAETGFPVVALDQIFEDGSVAGVASDNLAGGAIAAKELIDLGHTAIGFMGDVETDTVHARWEGFRLAALSRGIAAPYIYKLRGIGRLTSWEKSVAELVKRIVASRDKPTAILCSCDAVARFAMRAFAENGLGVPGDISIIGFDDDSIAEWTTPSLTTVRQDFEGMGAAAAELLLSFGSLQPTERKRLVPVSLVKRQSAR